MFIHNKFLELFCRELTITDLNQKIHIDNSNTLYKEKNKNISIHFCTNCIWNHILQNCCPLIIQIVKFDFNSFSESSQLIEKNNGKIFGHQTSEDWNSNESPKDSLSDTSKHVYFGYLLSILFVLFNGTNFVLTQVRNALVTEIHSGIRSYRSQQTDILFKVQLWVKQGLGGSFNK